MRAQINITVAQEDADAIRAYAEKMGMTVTRLIVTSVLGRDPIVPPSRQELAQRVTELEARLREAGL